MHRLIAHPDTPGRGIGPVTVVLKASSQREIWLEYHVQSSGGIHLPKSQAPGRADNLWKTTCFELFVRPENQKSYIEYNFSPSFQWAAYRLADYRESLHNVPAHDPEIAISKAGNDLFLAVEALPALPDGRLHIGLSAVIEETCGTKSYWALAHPPGKPDFHHPDCFALTLEAPDVS